MKITLTEEPNQITISAKVRRELRMFHVHKEGDPMDEKEKDIAKHMLISALFNAVFPDRLIEISGWIANGSTTAHYPNDEEMLAMMEAF